MAGRTINLASVKPDLDNLPVNGPLLKAFIAANGCLAKGVVQRRYRHEVT